MTDEVAPGRDDAKIVAAAGAPPAAWAARGARGSRGSRRWRGGRGSGHRDAGQVWEKSGWMMAVVWLVFLIYPVMGLVRSTADVAWIVTGWVGLVAFAVVYVCGFINGMSGSGGGLTTPPKAIQWTAFAGLIVCAACTVPAVGANALSFVPFIMSFASYGLTRIAHWVTTGVGIAITAAVSLWVPGESDYLSVLAIVVLLGVVNTVSTSLIIRSDEAEKLGLELATSEGREAVARDVHDLIGHSLTVVRMKAQLARRLIDADPERAKAELADIEALTAEAIAGVRETVAGVRSATLADQLASSRDVLKDAGVTLRLEGDVAALSPARSVTASWILREATTNVLRHAHATAVVVRITPGGLSVTDDGAGIFSGSGGSGSGAESETGSGSGDAAVSGVEGNGIRGMRERAAMAGAVLSMTAAQPHGTRVAVTW